MSLTENKIKRAYPKEKIYFLADDDGLSLKIEPNGRKTWSYRFSIVGTNKRPRISLGVYPVLTLKAARLQRDQFKANGYKLSATSKPKIKSFGDVCEEWLQFKARNSFGDQPRSGVVVLAQRCLTKEIYPTLSNVAFTEVGRADLIQVIRNIESRGVKEPVQKAYSYLNQIYDYAVAMGYCEFNKAFGLNKIILKNKVKKHYPYLKPENLAQFLHRLKNLDSDPIIKKAILFKLYTGVRGSELLMAEPHHFDFKKNIWTVPALHIKQYRRKVLAGHDIPDFIIPLSKQAQEVARSALEWTIGERYIFASPRLRDKPLHFNTINLAIRKMGYANNELSSHGLRSTFSTILNDSGLFQDSWIEAQLSHVDRNKTRASYNHAEYLSQRIEMMQWWGDYLQSKFDEI